MCCPSRVGFRGNLSIRPRMAVALVPARGRRWTSGGRCVAFTPQPSALVRSATAPKDAALARGLLHGGGTRRLTQESGGVAAVCGALSRRAQRSPIGTNPIVRLFDETCEIIRNKISLWP